MAFLKKELVFVGCFFFEFHILGHLKKRERKKQAIKVYSPIFRISRRTGEPCECKKTLREISSVPQAHSCWKQLAAVDGYLRVTQESLSPSPALVHHPPLLMHLTQLHPDYFLDLMFMASQMYRTGGICISITGVRIAWDHLNANDVERCDARLSRGCQGDDDGGRTLIMGGG